MNTEVVKSSSSKRIPSLVGPSDNPSKHIKMLTILRFAAAFMVFGFHFFSLPAEYKTLNKALAQGALGVDFFFLLSGFVLGYSYFNKFNDSNYKFSKRKFYVERLARIAPMYYIALLLSLPIFVRSFTLISTNEKSFVISAIPLTLTFLQSFPAFEFTIKNWNFPSWSLSVEFFFYLIFPIFSIGIIQRPEKTLKMLIFFFVLNVILFFTANSLPPAINLKGDDFSMSWRMHPFYHVPTFFIGNCLAPIFIKFKDLNYKKSIIGFTLFGILTSFVLLFPTKPEAITMGNPILLFCFSGMILFSAWIDQYVNHRLPALLILLGEASYSFYILQAPVKFFLQQIWSKFLKIDYVEGFSFAIYLSVTMLLISVLSYKFLEIPIRNKILKKYN